ncbi:MAG TPA: hypothetical protein VJ302_13220, partial [Blastocatellia bacterium]|nr:hypothetical protein [Blastocatellia bacterium]
MSITSRVKTENPPEPAVSADLPLLSYNKTPSLKISLEPGMRNFALTRTLALFPLLMLFLLFCADRPRV